MNKEIDEGRKGNKGATKKVWIDIPEPVFAARFSQRKQFTSRCYRFAKFFIPSNLTLQAFIHSRNHTTDQH